MRSRPTGGTCCRGAGREQEIPLAFGTDGLANRCGGFPARAAGRSGGRCRSTTGRKRRRTSRTSSHGGRSRRPTPRARERTGGYPRTVGAPGGPGAQASARRPRILALDDEPSIRAFLRKALTIAGMECVPFQDGAQALDGVREAEFDVMLIDHRMAGMSGTEFYEAAVELRPELARRAVFMSGDVLNPDLRGFATERDIRLLAKPFDIEAVIRVVREAWPRPTRMPAYPAAESGRTSRLGRPRVDRDLPVRARRPPDPSPIRLNCGLVPSVDCR